MSANPQAYSRIDGQRLDEARLERYRQVGEGCTFTVKERGGSYRRIAVPRARLPFNLPPILKNPLTKLGDGKLLSAAISAPGVGMIRIRCHVPGGLSVDQFGASLAASHGSPRWQAVMTRLGKEKAVPEEGLHRPLSREAREFLYELAPSVHASPLADVSTGAIDYAPDLFRNQSEELVCVWGVEFASTAFGAAQQSDIECLCRPMYQGGELIGAECFLFNVPENPDDYDPQWPPPDDDDGYGEETDDDSGGGGGGNPYNPPPTPVDCENPPPIDGDEPPPDEEEEPPPDLSLMVCPDGEPPPPPPPVPPAGSDSLGAIPKPDCSNPLTPGEMAWCSGTIPNIDSVRLQRVKDAIEGLKTKGPVCADLARIAEKILARGDLRIFAHTDGYAFGGVAPFFGGEDGERSWFALSDAWTDTYYDAAHPDMSTGRARTLQSEIAHEVDHLKGAVHTDSTEVWTTFSGSCAP